MYYYDLEYRDYKRALNLAKKEKKAARLGKPYPKPVKKLAEVKDLSGLVKSAKERVKQLRKERRAAK